jgi:hypothetical protein
MRLGIHAPVRTTRCETANDAVVEAHIHGLAALHQSAIPSMYRLK